MKLEGKVYEILDEFFNANLYRTLTHHQTSYLALYPTPLY
jgi:hypothetical protein